MTRKLYLPLVLLLAFSMLLAACGSQAPAEAPVVEKPAATACCSRSANRSSGSRSC